ncbi:GtrA family protein [Kitasatospora sp. NPDC093679]|uniref:GtrA family protein n=1 Tax=unclassified Kitasatospora TaxID=2633591 RepID=UPI003414C487
MSPQLWQVVRFGLVGVVNTGTFYLLYLAFHPYLPYFAAFSAAFFLSMVGSFFLNTYFTYRTRPTWRKFLLFPLPNITNYLVQSGGVFVLVEWARVDDRIAPLLAAAVAIPITYVLSKLVLTGRGTGPAGGSAQGDDLGPASARVEVVEQ